jgi:hypothetical protein
MELLLVYSTDSYGLFDAGTQSHCLPSAFEMTLLNKQVDKFKVMQAFVTHLQRVVKCESDQLKVSLSIMSYSQLRLTTGFRFSNGTSIRTELKSLAHLSPDEKDLLFTSLYSKAFEIQGDLEMTKLKRKYESDFADKSKFIEIISDHNTIIGFNLFKIVASTRNKLMVLTIDYALINPVYRGYGLMTLYTFRLAYALQLLKKDYKIAIFFLSIHFNSFKLIKDFLFYPKFQPAYMEKMVKSLLSVIYDGDYYYVKDLLTCYVREELRVRGSRYTASDDLQYKFFHEHLLGLDNNCEENRAVPVCFYVDNENYERLSHLCLTLGIHFFEHLQNLIKAFGQFLADYTNKPVTIPQNNNADDFKRIRNTFQFWFQQTDNAHPVPVFLPKSHLSA